MYQNSECTKTGLIVIETSTKKSDYYAKKDFCKSPLISCLFLHSSRLQFRIRIVNKAWEIKYKKQKTIFHYFIRIIHILLKE